MRLRLLVEVEADEATVENLRVWVATERRVMIDPGGDEYRGVTGTIVGAVPVGDDRSIHVSIGSRITPGLLGL